MKSEPFILNTNKFITDTYNSLSKALSGASIHRNGNELIIVGNSLKDLQDALITALNVMDRSEEHHV